MNLGKNIRSCRVARNWTQQALANELNTKRFNISAYEENRSTPPYEVLKRMIEVFEVPEDKVAHFIFGELDASSLQDERPGTSYIRLLEKYLKFTKDFHMENIAPTPPELSDLWDKITVARAMLNLSHPEFVKAL